MGPPKLADTLQISLEEAEQLFKEYAQAFPKLNKWLENQANFGKINGYIRLHSPHNGIRWFPDIKLVKQLRREPELNWREIHKLEGKVERDSMNTGIQGKNPMPCINFVNCWKPGMVISSQAKQECLEGSETR